jgi:hypothetical protein
VELDALLVLITVIVIKNQTAVPTKIVAISRDVIGELRSVELAGHSQ